MAEIDIDGRTDRGGDMLLLPGRVNARIRHFAFCTLRESGVTTGWLRIRDQTAGLLAGMSFHASTMT